MKKKEKRNYKQEIKEWWSENKRVIKTGAVCLGIGVLYGFTKGVNSVTDTMLRWGHLPTDTDNTDDFEYDETNVDDPELLELIRLEQESDES